MDKLAGIYKITNKQNNKIYIGESEDIAHRWIEHITDLVCGEHCNSKLQTDFDIYGIKNFEFDILQTTINTIRNGWWIYMKGMENNYVEFKYKWIWGWCYDGLDRWWLWF